MAEQFALGPYGLFPAYVPGPPPVPLSVRPRAGPAPAAGWAPKASRASSERPGGPPAAAPAAGASKASEAAASPTKTKPARAKKAKPPKPHKPPTKKELRRRAAEERRRQREKERAAVRLKPPARDPAAPKRARTAFNFFLNDFRVTYKSAHPESKGIVDATRACSETWKTMSEELKAPYVKLAQAAAKEYAAAKAKYEAEGGPLKFKLQTATRPKRPPTAYFVFLKTYREEYKAQHPDAKGIRDMSMSAGKAWQGMSEVERKPYKDRALAAKAEYMKIKDLPLEERKVHIGNEQLYARFETGPLAGPRDHVNVNATAALTPSAPELSLPVEGVPSTLFDGLARSSGQKLRPMWEAPHPPR